MARDFISELFYFLFDENKKEHPIPPDQQTRFWDKIHAMLKGTGTSSNAQNEGE